jgi:hypothetical protein
MELGLGSLHRAYNRSSEEPPAGAAILFNLTTWREQFVLFDLITRVLAGLT